MKKNNVFKMVFVLMLISLASGAVLTLANNKLAPIIKARESDKMRLVAEELLPGGSVITKVTKYKDLALLVSNARVAKGLESSWKWEPSEATLGTIPGGEPEPAPAQKHEIDFSDWGDFFVDTEETAVEEDLDVPMISWDDFGIDFDTDQMTESEEDFDVPEINWDDFGIDFASPGGESIDSDEELPVISWDDFGVDFGPIEPTITQETPDDASIEPEEDETPSFEIYQALQNGKLSGIALITKASGYSGDVVLILALDGTLETVLGMQVLQQTETAGLGSKITEEKFTAQFSSKKVNNPFEVGLDIDKVAGATVSSKAVTTAIHRGLENLEQFLIDGTIKEGA